VLSMFFDSPEFLRLAQLTPRDATASENSTPVCLARVLLEIASDAWNAVDREHYIGMIDDLALRVERGAPTSDPAEILRRIGQVLFHEEGYRGNAKHFFDARNSYLNYVLDRKVGIPISLAALHVAVARKCGLAASGSNLPMHFMVRVELADGPMWVDAFNRGTLLTMTGVTKFIHELSGRPLGVAAHHLAACSDRVLVIRALNNLKAIYLREGNFHAAIRVISRLLALKPGDVDEQRDLGFACFRAGRAREARNWLTPYIDARPNADDLSEVRAVVESLSAGLK